jgi:hypothetical protein
LAVSGIFAFLFVLQIVHCCIATLVMRGHRLPYLVLLPTILFTTISLLAILSYTAVFASAGGTINLRTDLIGVFLFFRNWSLTLIFVAIIAFLWEREATICARSNGKRNVPLLMVHLALIALLFIFGTAHAASNSSLRHDAARGLSRANTLAYIRRIKTTNGLAYTFFAILILSAVDVIVTAFTVSKAAKNGPKSDKVCATMHFSEPRD